MKSKDIKYVLNIAMRLTVIVAVVVAMLATVNAVTKERIAENNAASRRAANLSRVRSSNPLIFPR